MPSLRAKSLPRPPGMHPEHAVGLAQLARDRAEQPVPAHRRGDLARREGAARQLAGVGERVRALDPEGQPARPQAALDGGQEPRGTATPGAGVHDEAERAPGHVRGER